MKRFHVHVHVDDLSRNIAFYSAMFNQEPARSEADYAKWMLADPPVNFAISTRGSAVGVDHLGIQVENAEDLAALRQDAANAELTILDDGETSCCYARSDKYWVTDPQGIAWEQFHTLASIPVFSEEKPTAIDTACCAAPAASPVQFVRSRPAPAGEAKACC